MGVALGLGAALSWGLADYFAAVASRSVGALRVVLGFHLAALIPLAVLVLATDGLAHVDGSQVAVFVGVGAVGWVSYLAFYGALAIGPISVLSPIISGYAAVTVLLAVLLAGEHVSAVQAVAVTITIAGAMLASADVREIARANLERRSALGFVLALCAMALLGGFVFGVSYYRSTIGWLGPIFLARGFAALFLTGNLVVAGRAARLPGSPPSLAGDGGEVVDAANGTVGAVDRSGDAADRSVAVADRAVTEAVQSVGGSRLTRERARLLGLIVVLAVLDTGGYVCFNLGVGHASTAVVAAASAPYAVVPIVMGVSLFAERPTRPQWLGVALVILGVIVLGAFT